MKQLMMILAIAATAVFAGPAHAQQKQPPRDKHAPAIPEQERPPAGMCRIWLENVPAGQQPAPTDCATAVRNRPPNGRVIFGDDYVKDDKKNDDKKKLPPFVKDFAHPAPAPRRP
ncbi:MAG TPA: hypothetical protein VJU87_12820 [Gemmatimonadaceae bacterium]|nr:hypothetical protein [Gemmatimonadaceae bacterium]